MLGMLRFASKPEKSTPAFMREPIMAVGGFARNMALHNKEARGWRHTTRLGDGIGKVYSVRSNSPIIGQSPQMLRVFELIRKAAATRFPVLIFGEPGTGKSLVAENIHALGPRHEEVFVPIHCLELSVPLIASA